jgi:hypothetical protein
MEIKGRAGLIHKLVYEVRYHEGYLYLDRCGITANRIVSTYPEWIVRNPDLNPQQAPLVSIKNGTAFTYNSLKYDFAFEQPTGGQTALNEADVKEFASQASLVSTIVHEELELKKFTRVGFRIWYLFGSESKSDSEDWIKNLGTLKIDDRIKSAFKGEMIGQNLVVVIKSHDRNFRIALNGVESDQRLDLGNEILNIKTHKLPKGQREMMLKQERVRQRILANPRFAAMIDVDANVEDPVEAIAGDFIEESFKQIEKGLKDAF